MKKLLCFLLAVTMCMGMTVTVVAETNSKNQVTQLTCVRSNAEIQNLKMIYKQLFPDEYNYIEQYEKNGTNKKIGQNKSQNHTN